MHLKKRRGVKKVLEARGNNEIFYSWDKKNCPDGYNGNACANGLVDYYHRKRHIEQAKNFDRLPDDYFMDDFFMEKERLCRYAKAVIIFDIAVICIVVVDIALMLFGGG